MKLMNTMVSNLLAIRGARVVVGLALALAGTSSARAADPIVGRYQVDGHGVARVNGDNYWGGFSDRFRFDANRKFGMRGISGTWKRSGNKYSVSLGDGVKGRLERELRDELPGVRITSESLALKNIRTSEGVIRGDISGSVTAKFHGIRYRVTAGGNFTGDRE